MPELAVRDPADIIEAVVLQGDLARLRPDERVAYYRQVCRSLGLNELTQPFAYITLNGKLTLYATKACTDQLRELHGVSITRLEFKTVGDIYVATAYAQDKSGRTDSATGPVAIAGLRGEALANAMMKSETKSKRRVTLSICGLGWTDESEIETIPGAQPVQVDADTGEFVPLRAQDPEPDPGPRSITGKLLMRYGQILTEARHAGAITEAELQDYILPSQAGDPYIIAKGKELVAKIKAVSSGGNQPPRSEPGETPTPPAPRQSRHELAPQPRESVPESRRVTVRSVLGQQLANLVEEAARLEVPFDDCRVEFPAVEERVIRAIERLQDRTQDKKDQLAGLDEADADPADREPREQESLV